jgi:hypothetical protein
MTPRNNQGNRIEAGANCKLLPLLHAILNKVNTLREQRRPVLVGRIT